MLRGALLLSSLASLVSCNKTTAEPPVEEGGGTEVGIILLGALGGVFVLCVVLICLVKVLFKRPTRHVKDTDDIEMGTAVLMDGEREGKRKVAEMKVDFPEFTAVELDYLLGKHGWDKDEVGRRIQAGSIVPLSQRKNQRSSEHSGSSASTLRGRVLTELKHINPQFTPEEILYLLKAHNWDAHAVQNRINTGSVVSFADAGGVEGSRSSNSRGYQSPRSRGSSSSLRVPSSGSFGPSSPALGSSFVQIVGRETRSPRGTAQRIRPLPKT